MDLKVTQGKTIRLPADFYSGSKRVDPVDPRVKVVNAKGVAVVRNETPERDSRGVYHYDFKVDPDAPLGIWQAIWTAQIDDRGVSGSDPFEVLPAAVARAEVESPPRPGRSSGGAPGSAAAGRAAAGAPSSTATGRSAPAGAAASSAASPPAALDAGRQSGAPQSAEAGRGPQPAPPTSQRPGGRPVDPPRTGTPAPAVSRPSAAAPPPPSKATSPRAQAGSAVTTPSPSEGRRAPEAGGPSRAPETGTGRATPSGPAPKAPAAGGGKATEQAPRGSSPAGRDGPPGSRSKESISGKAARPAAPKAAAPAAAAAVAADQRRREGRTGFDADVDGKEQKIRPFGRKAARGPDESAASPGPRGSRLSRGQALLIAGALGIVLLAIWLSPRRSDTVQSKIDQGVAAQKAGRTEEAERLYQEVLRSDPENKLANFNLGVSAHRAGRTEEAEVLYNKSLEADPNFLPALFNLAILQENTGRNEESEATYRRILEEYPDNGPAHLNLGFLLIQKLNRPEEGRAAFARAIELDESLGARIPAELRPAAPAGPPAP